MCSLIHVPNICTMLASGSMYTAVSSMTQNSHSRNMSLQQSQIESPGSRRWWSCFRWYISCFSIYILIWDRMHSFEQCIFRNTKHTLQKTRWEYHSCPSQVYPMIFSCFFFRLPLIFLFILLGGDTLIFRVNMVKGAPKQLTFAWRERRNAVGYNNNRMETSREIDFQPRS